MASSGSITGAYRGYTLLADWSAVQNAAGNYSDVTVNHTLVIGSAYSLNIVSRTNTCSVGGVSQGYTSGSINQKGGSVLLGTTVHRVSHNADGTKTAQLTDTFNINATIDGTKVGSITASGSISLDRIARNATIVTANDKLESTDYALTLGKGIPTCFIDIKKSSVGVNCLPSQSDVLQLGESAWLTAQGAYPVGAIYLSVTDANPAALFGGTWERIGGRFLLGADTTYTAGSTGGEAAHTLTVDEMPKHNHDVNNLNESGSATPFMTVQAQDKKGYGGNVKTMYAGGGKAHNNMPPYLAVYMWQRVS